MRAIRTNYSRYNELLNSGDYDLRKALEASKLAYEDMFQSLGDEALYETVLFDVIDSEGK